mgnify:CR=1 FL=1
MSGATAGTAFLSCTNCGWSMHLPVGTPVSVLRSDCAECQAGVTIEQTASHGVVIRDSAVAPSGPSEEDSEIGFDFLPPSMGEQDIEVLDYAETPESTELQTKTISGFVNRITPIVLATQVIASMMRSGVSMGGEEVLDRINKTSVSYRRALQHIEDKHGVGRGSRLSDGFPDDDEKSIRRFSRTYMGADPSKGTFTEGAGLGQQLGLVDLEYSQEGDSESVNIRLTEAGKKALSIKLHREPVLEEEEHKAAGAGQVSLPRWLSKDDVERVVNIIESRSNAEYLWIRFILEQIDAVAMGLTSEDLTNREIERELREGQDRRWFDRGSDVPIVTVMRSEDASEEEIQERLYAKISATIGGTLSRMKELSLIFKFKRARKSYYKSTKSGKEWVRRWYTIEE